ncbi:S1-C subfamily serine protease [Labrenzia sp. EL_126]|nr:S1-C subfamily serine protease [Labrenzia sp. EL_126]
MRLLVVCTVFVFFTFGVARADYAQSKEWFYSQSYEDRIATQLLLIFTGDYVAIVDATFGKRTYEAVLKFQNRHGFATDGALDQREADKLWAEGGAVMNKLGFEFRDEPSSGVTLGIPESLFSSVAPTRRGFRWEAKDRLVELETLKIPHYETDYRKLYDRLSSESRTRQVEYKLLRNDYFIVSGKTKGKNFYLRLFRTNGDTRGFSLSWDDGLGVLMDRVAVAMSNSLAFYDGSSQANLPSSPRPSSPPVSSPPKKGAAKRTSSSGSGYFISEDGHVGTNAHVIEECRNISVAGFGRATITKMDNANDLAIIHVITQKQYAVAKFRPLPVRRGEEVYVLGFPLGALLGNNLTISEGIVSSLAGIRGDVRHFHLSAPVQPGNSGGPVLDASGSIIGTVVAKLDAMATLELAGTLPENINFAVRGNMMAALMASVNVEPTYSSSEAGTIKNAADIASEAENFTVQITCQ